MRDADGLRGTAPKNQPIFLLFGEAGSPTLALK